MDNPFEFRGKVVLVTGGTRGIGRGIAQRFQSAGAQVVVCGRKAPEVPVGSGAGSALFLPCDVRDPDAVDDLIAAAATRLGGLDIAVNNAGGSPPADAATASPGFSEAIVRLNLLGPLFVAQAANRVMQLQDGGGVIVNIASVAAMRPSPATAAYGAAKAGLLNLTQSLAVEWAPKVRVNAVICGLVETELAGTHYGDADAMARVAATVPMRRMGTPRDVADACLYLCSSAASYVSGASLTVHGGGERPAFLTAVNDA